MYEPKGRDYFKSSSRAIGILYIVLGIIAAYCVGIIFLPNFAKWCWESINNIIDYFSQDDPNWGLFVKGFFWSCTGSLVAIGIILKVMDYINLTKKHGVDVSEEISKY